MKQSLDHTPQHHVVDELTCWCTDSVDHQQAREDYATLIAIGADRAVVARLMQYCYYNGEVHESLLNAGPCC